MRSLLQRVLRSSSYQVGILFATLMLVGLAVAAYGLLIAADDRLLREAPEAIQAELRTVGWVMILLLALIFALSWGVAYYVATRFERIAATTGRIIETGNLRERLSVDSSWDDLSKLAVLLNRMLAELEARVDGIKSVSDNIAHDLRTPLMRLRTRIEADTEGGTRDELLAELDHTLDIFRSLLRISSIEAGKQTLALAQVDAGALLADAAALYEPLAEEKAVRLVAKVQELTVEADRDLLFQALANLVDNALKFTPAGGEVHCVARREADGVVLAVEDSGPGIPADERDLVLRRFVRLDDSRSAPGNGLGLPLVLAIARRHGGSLELAEATPGKAPPGLRVTLRLPRVAGRRDAA
ncbi:MAG: HAMP domain-containing sensor histidine kinase [Pseudomonadota bacterium]